MPALHLQRALPASEVAFIGHAEHAPCPDTFLYSPATHGKQLPPSLPVCPTPQTQAVETELADGEFEFAGHAAQAVALARTEYEPGAHASQWRLPGAGLYFPATHPVHPAAPSGPVRPEGHLQSVSALLPARESESAGQPKHVLVALAAVAAEYFPWPHKRHSVFP